MLVRFASREMLSSSKLVLPSFSPRQANRSISVVLSVITPCSRSICFHRSTNTTIIAASASSPVFNFRTVNCAYFSKSSSGSDQRPTGRDKGKEDFYVPTPRNPKVLIAIPEDAEYPTVPEEEVDEYEVRATAATVFLFLSMYIVRS